MMMMMMIIIIIIIIIIRPMCICIYYYVQNWMYFCIFNSNRIGNVIHHKTGYSTRPLSTEHGPCEQSPVTQETVVSNQKVNDFQRLCELGHSYS